MTQAYPLNSREEKRAFYRMIFTLVVPIALQNLITTAIGSTDVVMLKYVGQQELAAVSAAAQVNFVLGLFLFGISSGACVLTAQYWGKRDTRTIGRAMRCALTVAVVFALATGLMPERAMRIFTDDAALIAPGATYLRVVSVSYLFNAVSAIYMNIVRSMERVRISTLTFLASFLVNVLLNACLIFGLFGLPKLGVLGVAIATTAARFVELAICLLDASRSGAVRPKAIDLVRHDAALMKEFMRYALPSMANEIMWGTGFTMYTVILGHLSSDVLAAYSIVQVVRNLACVVGFGLANGAGIALGKVLGEGRVEAAKVYGQRLLRLTICAGLLGSAIMLLTRPLVLRFAGDLTATATGYLNIMLWINAYYTFGMVFNTFMVCGVFRAGGDVKYGFIVDTIAQWGVFVPLGALCAFVWKLPVMAVYTVLCLDEATKMPINIWHYTNSNWARDITREWT